MLTFEGGPSSFHRHPACHAHDHKAADHQAYYPPVAGTTREHVSPLSDLGRGRDGAEAGED